MKLFAKKAAEPAPAPAPAPPVAAPTAPPARDTESVLKLDLPDVFAYEQHETRAKPAARRAADADTDSLPTRGTVLLVEGDEEVCRLVSRLLQHEGFSVVKTTCLAEARAAMNDVRPDFLLARRHSVPLNLQTEHVLRELSGKTDVRVVDDFSELMLGQVVDYESMSQCALALAGLLMSLLEGANVGARGHAHSVAKYCRLVGQRLGLSRRELDGLTLTALLHDLGALEITHAIGAISIQNNQLSLPSLRPTLDMLSNIAFPYPVNELLSAAGEVAANPDKPAARILRVADVYDTLRRAQGGAADEDALFDQMRRLPADALDAEALETFVHLRKQERLISAMNIFWAAILLVDPRPEELQLLRLRLENDDYQVRTARSLEEALHILRTEKITLVVTERLLSGTGDGFELLRTMKSDSDLAHIPVVFHAPPNTDHIKQALELGAEDWLAKPHNVEIIAMKLHRIVGRLHVDPAAGHDGVQGNIRDMGILELVQVLSVGCRSVQILLTKGKTLGELSLQKGQIISATAGSLEGEAAALEILGWDDGQFRILPLKQPPPVSIRTSTDTLLLQACYRKDQQTTPHD